MQLSEQARERYARQLVLPGLGEPGQVKLAQARVLVVGVGGLGSPAAIYLAAAGVGHIGLVDSDAVELSNLNRQILHTLADIDRAKTESAQDKLAALNPEVAVELHPVRATADNLPALARRHDFVLDCTDSYEAKFLINDVCVEVGVPFTHAGVLVYGGQMMSVLPGQTACLRCLFPSPPEPGVFPSPAEAGIFGSVPGVVGTLQACEAVRFLLGIGELLCDRVLTYDGLAARFREIKVPRDPGCACCGLLDRSGPR